jgi:hypothetical protein
VTIAPRDIYGPIPRREAVRELTRITRQRVREQRQGRRDPCREYVI